MTKNDGRKNETFTLAEVLITLGIIGIVAAITLPNLMMTLQGNKYRNQFKKSLSTLNQAVRNAQAQYDLDFASLNEACLNPASENPDTKHSLCAMFNATLKGVRYLGNLYELGYEEALPFNCGYAYQLADGSIVGFRSKLKNCKLSEGQHAVTEDMLKSGGALENCVGFIDVNGTSGPNELVQGEPVNTSSYDFHRLLDRISFEYDTNLRNHPAFAYGYGYGYGEPTAPSEVPPSPAPAPSIDESYFASDEYNNLNCENGYSPCNSNRYFESHGYSFADEYSEQWCSNFYIYNTECYPINGKVYHLQSDEYNNYICESDEYALNWHCNQAKYDAQHQPADKCASDVFDPQAVCNVPNKRHFINDIFPIVFHDGVVEPASGPARNVLHTAK